jgi:hypothetical protein
MLHFIPFSSVSSHSQAASDYRVALYLMENGLRHTERQIDIIFMCCKTLEKSIIGKAENHLIFSLSDGDRRRQAL